MAASRALVCAAYYFVKPKTVGMYSWIEIDIINVGPCFCQHSRVLITHELQDVYVNTELPCIVDCRMCMTSSHPHQLFTPVQSQDIGRTTLYVALVSLPSPSYLVLHVWLDKQCLIVYRHVLSLPWFRSKN